MKRVMIILATTMLAPRPSAEACTRVMYKGVNTLVLTARSMDWREDMQTNLWAFPRGMRRDGATGINTISWTSKYGSVVASSYDIASTDGMNEKGLVANLLWLSESQYPAWNGSRKGLSISLWAQYALDNFATVAEAVKEFSKERFVIVTAEIPTMRDRLATLHLSLSDATGDNAIFEYVDGRLTIHHSPDYKVMTNSPAYGSQLALDDYWRQIGGTVMLPGTNRAADRFARASFYTDAVPVVDNPELATAIAFSIIRNASVLLGISTPDQPHIASTIWRVVADQTDLIYFFESVYHPNIFWVNLHDIDFGQGAPVRVLALSDGQTYSGNAARDFVPSAPFVFAGI